MHSAIRLPGRHHDRETGLHYNRHEYYDPVLGAYVNQDPIGLNGRTNISVYAPDPLQWIDSLGLVRWG
ncbi:RHS repeat-associated core domain-containing protein [Delftia acidovorans]